MKRRNKQLRSQQAAFCVSTDDQKSRPPARRTVFIDKLENWGSSLADRSAIRWPCLSRWAGFLVIGLVITALILGIKALRFPAVVPGADIQFDDAALSAAHEAACNDVRWYPQTAAAWAHLGLLLAAHDHSEPAITCLAQAASLEPAEWRWPYFQGVVESESNLSRAVAAVTEAVNRNPQDEWPRIQQATWLLILGRHAEAEAVYRDILADHPDHAAACLGLARVLSHGNALRAAIAELSPALSHPATRQAAHVLLAQLQARQGDASAAKAALTAAQDLPADIPWPDDPLPQALNAVKLGKHDMLDRIAVCEANGDDYQGKHLTRILIRFHPEFALLLQGRRQLAEGDALGAEQSFRSGLTSEPESIELAHGLGRSLAAQGRISEAATVFRHILTQEPAYRPAWADLATCLGQSDRDGAQRAAANAARYGRSYHPATTSP